MCTSMFQHTQPSCDKGRFEENINLGVGISFPEMLCYQVKMAQVSSPDGTPLPNQGYPELGNRRSVPPPYPSPGYSSASPAASCSSSPSPAPSPRPRSKLPTILALLPVCVIFFTVYIFIIITM